MLESCPGVGRVLGLYFTQRTLLWRLLLVSIGGVRVLSWGRQGSRSILHPENLVVEVVTCQEVLTCPGVCRVLGLYFIQRTLLWRLLLVSIGGVRVLSWGRQGSRSILHPENLVVEVVTCLYRRC